MDGLGNPVYFQLSSGNVNDNTLAVEVLSHVEIKDSNILGDKAYGTKEIREYIVSQEATYTIPPKSNTQNPWECNWWIYKERHSVECFTIKSNNFVELQPDMTNWHLLFLPLCIVHPYLFCANSIVSVSFQALPSVILLNYIIIVNSSLYCACVKKTLAFSQSPFLNDIIASHNGI